LGADKQRLELAISHREKISRRAKPDRDRLRKSFILQDRLSSLSLSHCLRDGPESLSY
jgi:hypothetical protein